LDPKGHVKFWLTAGRGGFGISDAECTEPGFYAIVTTEWADEGLMDGGDYDRTVGVKAVTRWVYARVIYIVGGRALIRLDASAMCVTGGCWGKSCGIVPNPRAL
jgi:hypothetical protein